MVVFADALRRLREAAWKRQEGVREDRAMVKRADLQELLKQFDRVDGECREHYKDSQAVKAPYFVDNLPYLWISKLAMPMVVVYCRPRDYPNSYVARVFNGNRPTNVVIVKDSLAEIRGALPDGMIRLGRDANDDPVIVETWI